MTGESRVHCGAWLCDRNCDWSERCQTPRAERRQSKRPHCCATLKQRGDLCGPKSTPDACDHRRKWPSCCTCYEMQSGIADWSSRCFTQTSTRAECAGGCRAFWLCEIGGGRSGSFPCLSNSIQEHRRRKQNSILCLTGNSRSDRRSTPAKKWRQQEVCVWFKPT